MLIGVIDTETDPFKYRRIPKPFCVEFYSDRLTEQFWGDDCIDQLCNYLETLEGEYLIFAHNGGKFDFHFMFKYLDNPVKIINSRIVSASVFHHTVRDSFSIIPVPLRDYEKETFDYGKMEKNVREKNKSQILHYLHSDCVHLYTICSAFVDRFGPKLTVGSTAIAELKKRHKFKRMTAETDAQFRPYYYGGRVECFESGIIPGPWKVYDVNSMYPKAMRDFNHPCNGAFSHGTTIPTNDETYFIHFKGFNHGALPTHTPEGLNFNVPYGEFFACSHEMKVAAKYGLVEIEEIYSVYTALEHIRFETFVDDFYSEKLASKLAGDKLSEMFSKFMLNSGAGKFGQNPENFEDYQLVREPGRDIELMQEGYNIKQEYPEFEIWAKPSEIFDHSYYDVSIAASITSAARSMLLEGIQNAERPIYCDTDSLICKSLNAEISSKTLGAWKDEGTAATAAIAGKKLYTLYDNPNTPKKLASKGGDLKIKDIINLCKGKEFIHENMAPTFSLNKSPHFITRKFRSTIDLKAKSSDKDSNSE